MKPTISVLMPAFNAAPYISESIQSILGQTLSNFELIIVDDGSTDLTWDIINKFALTDRRIQAHQNSKNLKIAKTRNLLIGFAQGSYIAWQDADDISISNRLARQYQFLENHPEVGIVGSSLEFFSDQGTLKIRTYATHDVTLRKNIFKFSPVAQPAAMIRKNILDVIGGYDQNLKQAEDLDMTFRIGQRAKFANIQDVLLRYRYHPLSVSNHNIYQNIIDTLRVRKKAITKYGYEMETTDKIAFFATYISALAARILPSDVILRLFNLLRTMISKTS